MRADRLISILMLLQTKGRLTAQELAQQLEVSERTIYRDLEALSIAGVPIYTERGPGGGYELLNGYQTRLNGLTESETQALFLSHVTGPLADLGLAQALDQAMLKLSVALPAPARASMEQMRQRIHFDASGWHHDDNPSTMHLHMLQEALNQKQELTVCYATDDATSSELRVAPYGLVSKAHIWYLVACCSGQICVLRVSRIQHLQLLNNTFEHPLHFDLAAFWSNYCAEVEINTARYAVPLHLAPEDAPHIQQTLNSWGYALMENEEPLPEYAPGLLCQETRQRNHYAHASGQPQKILLKAAYHRPRRRKKEKKPTLLQKNPVRLIKKRVFSRKRENTLVLKKTNSAPTALLPVCA